MKTEKLLEELENLIAMSQHLPLTSKRLIEEEDIMRIIDAINESLPLELQESRNIMAERDEILSDAQRQADALIAQAKEYINKLTEEHELVRHAQEQAASIIADANRSSEQYKTSSLTYACDVLKYVEGNLEKALENIRQNRASLTQHTNTPE